MATSRLIFNEQVLRGCVAAFLTTAENARGTKHIVNSLHVLVHLGKERIRYSLTADNGKCLAYVIRVDHDTLFRITGYVLCVSGSHSLFRNNNVTIRLVSVLVDLETAAVNTSLQPPDLLNGAGVVYPVRAKGKIVDWDVWLLWCVKEVLATVVKVRVAHFAHSERAKRPGNSLNVLVFFVVILRKPVFPVINLRSQCASDSTLVTYFA